MYLLCVCITVCICLSGKSDWCMCLRGCMSICQKIWDWLCVWECVCIYCSFAQTYCGCVFLREWMLVVCVFSCPTVDWLDRMLLAMPPCVFGHITLSVMLLFSNKATVAQSCLPPKHEPRMMKLCALPNCKASFTPWYLHPSPFALALELLSCSLSPGCSGLTFCYRLSHSQPVSYLSIRPSDFTNPFVVINQSSAARERVRKPERCQNSGQLRTYTFRLAPRLRKDTEFLDYWCSPFSNVSRNLVEWCVRGLHQKGPQGAPVIASCRLANRDYSRFGGGDLLAG